MFVKGTASSQPSYFQPLTTEGKWVVAAAIIALVVGSVIAALGMHGYFGPSFGDGHTLSTSIGGLVSSTGLGILIILGVLNHFDRPEPPKTNKEISTP